MGENEGPEEEEEDVTLSRRPGCDVLWSRSCVKNSGLKAPAWSKTGSDWVKMLVLKCSADGSMAKEESKSSSMGMEKLKSEPRPRSGIFSCWGIAVFSSQEVNGDHSGGLWPWEESSVAESC